MGNITLPPDFWSDCLNDTTRAVPDSFIKSMTVVGITTAPRSRSYLSECVISLASAGFEGVRVFAEPGTDLGGLTSSARLIQRPTRLGAWHNWREMCRELLDTSDAEIILTVQDDTLFSTTAGERLQALWPADVSQLGFLSLYSPSHYQKKYAARDASGHPHGYFPDMKAAQRYVASPRNRAKRLTVKEHVITAETHRVSTRSLWGACALAFPRESLRRIIDHRIARDWKGVGKRNPAPDRICNVDTAIGKICNALGLHMLFTNPATAQHIGGISSLGHGGLGGRREALFVSDDLRPASVRPARSPVTAPSRSLPVPPCIHRGPQLQLIGCGTCRGHVQIKTFACSIHGETTIAQPLPDLNCCAGCDDYES